MRKVHTFDGKAYFFTSSTSFAMDVIHIAFIKHHYVYVFVFGFVFTAGCLNEHEIDACLY